MAVLTLPHSIAFADLPIRLESWLTVEPQGAEDKQLRENARQVIAHLQIPAEYQLRLHSHDEYVSIPFQPTKKIRVTYRQAGTLKPASYPLNE